MKLPSKIREIAPRAFDIFGNIAIVKLSDESFEYSKIIAESLLASNPNVDRVALDLGVKGEYRVRELQMIAGEADFVSVHKENGFEFELDISKVYFSPRLAMERKRIYDMSIDGERVLDAFAGASPFSVALASKGCNITAVDSNPQAEIWSNNNFQLNGVSKSNYTFICSKVEDIASDLLNYDRIVMNNPTNSLPYLEPLSHKLKYGGVIHLYNIRDKGEKFEIQDFLGSEFECVFEREVHPYSPQSSLMVFDILKSVSNVQSTNQ
tara:strand:+ start:1 stop:798 length:798 start_codon:yes stop_codon:yes gene_type:complete